jgi:hypothetical protein
MTDPTRKIGEAMLGTEAVEVVVKSPTGLALIGQNLTRIAAVVGALAFTVGGIFAFFLPQPWAVTACAVCTSIVLLTTQITGISPGVRTQAGAAPVVANPKVGPPA